MNFNTIYFTSKDDSISGTSQRDPLGLQPIWSYYGRKVINHLTTISTTIHGFREVLLCLSICNEIKDCKKDITFKDLILLFEQLFIYTAISKEKKEGILGADNGSVKYEKEKGNPTISSKDSETILVREISLGYYGRYKTPLVTMGIINNKSEVIISLQQIKELFKDSYSEILSDFEKFVKSDNRSFYSFQGTEKLFEAVFGSFRETEKDFWLNRLYEYGGKKNVLTEECYEEIPNESNDNIRTIARNLFNSIPETKEVANILFLEPYLRCLEEVFYKAINSKSISALKQFLTSEKLQIYKERYEKFCLIERPVDTSDLLINRIDLLINDCKPTLDNYVEKVLEYHRIVCAQKKSSVWVENSNGNLQSFVSVDNENIDLSEWGRDYYLSSLKSIKAEILEFSK